MAARWADLPPELLSIISGSLPKPIDVLIFRHVCRSWRFSSSPPRNNLSPCFPLTGYYFPSPRFQFLTVYAAAVYLLRPRSDPSKPWLVSVQEPVAGKLVLRHALTHEKINLNLVGRNYSLDMSSDDWISATRISRSFEYGTGKVAFVSNSAGSTPSIGFGKTNGVLIGGLFTFYLGFNGGGDTSRSAMPPIGVSHYPCEDFAKLDGRIYAVCNEGNMYVFDGTDWSCQKIPVSRWHYRTWIRLVVSDGDLYMALRFFDDRCWIYRLERHTWKEVRDLGDRVFFFAKNGSSFSVSARDLPPPWKPNCIAIFDQDCCLIQAFQFGEGDDQMSLVSSLQGYYGLFAPPSFIVG